ncbi:putative secreted protein [Candidatus Protofrankia californiensis]|uniref:Putative secreted protein n=1 Tax=Candidatus Protofrankia californiensis TaxID=1839754 RepID=A0A1C3NWM9_9ACTN|nr:putative secreted protein [Candidatus Protofrankia californiensis]
MPTLHTALAWLRGHALLAALAAAVVAVAADEAAHTIATRTAGGNR